MLVSVIQPASKPPPYLEHYDVDGRNIFEVEDHRLRQEGGLHQVAVCDDGGGERRCLLVLVGVGVALHWGLVVPGEGMGEGGRCIGGTGDEGDIVGSVKTKIRVRVQDCGEV